jgi:hypothetical protein
MSVLGVYRRIEYISGPLIQTLARGLGGHQGGSMNFGSHAQQEFARSWFFWFDTLAFAIRKEIVNRRLQFMPQLGNRLAMKADDAAKP